MKSAMLEEAHKALEAMSVAANAMKDEEWGEAERALITVQEFVARLLREVGDKTQEKLLSPKPEERDRG
jgi:putative Ca2+/H+ antiporter (TMEM165/GDT1 family)